METQKFKAELLIRKDSDPRISKVLTDGEEYESERDAKMATWDLKIPKGWHEPDVEFQYKTVPESSEIEPKELILKFKRDNKPDSIKIDGDTYYQVLSTGQTGECRLYDGIGSKRNQDRLPSAFVDRMKHIKANAAGAKKAGLGEAGKFQF